METLTGKTLADALQKPFDPDDLEWKIQSCGENDQGIWALVVPYIKASAIRDRLDEVIGPENWRPEKFEPGAAGGLQCGLSLRINEEWVTKWDGAENTGIEGVKGGMSDAFKRAARVWGIGRYLTRVEVSFADIVPHGKFRGKTRNKKSFRWNPPGLPSFCFPQNLPGKEEHRTWQEKANAFQETTRDIQEAARQPLPEETKEKKKIDRMINRIQEEIKKVQRRQIRIDNRKSAFVYLNKRLWQAGADWQKLLELEAEIARLLEEWEREAAA